jgi:adenylate cyclase
MPSNFVEPLTPNPPIGMSTTVVKSRLAAVLSADAAGYSRLMGHDEEGAIAAIGAARSLFRETIAAHHGRVVDTAGDNVLAVFESVVEALRSALEIQDELARRSEEVPEDRRMLFRIGVNAGEVVEESDGSVYGDGVNIAARLQALAEAGGVCVSDVVVKQAGKKVAVRFESLGEQRLKNIAEPVHVYRVLHERAAVTSGTGLPLPAKPSIAVLSFVNMSGDSEQEYFSDGIAEDLITALSRIRWLFVVARNSTFTYKGQAVDVKQVGRALGVRYVVEGSVRRGGNRVRITAQLIDAVNGNHVWAERYDRELADVFAVQDEITDRIAAAIEPELARAELERARRKPPESLDAWDLYQRGLWHVWQFNARDNQIARELFERAAALDPGFSPFFAGIALSRLFDHTLRYRPASERSIDVALAAARHAVALDDKDAAAHSILGRTYTALGEFAEGIAEMRKALRLNPNLALTHYGLGIAFVLSGRPKEAIPEFDTAERLSPHDPYLWNFSMWRAWARLSLDDFAGAVEDAKNAVRQPRAPFPTWATLASALGSMGHIEEARAAFTKALELEPLFSPQLFEQVWPNSDAALLTKFFDGLRRIDAAITDPRAIIAARPARRTGGGET